MANASAKRIAQSNAAWLDTLQKVIMGSVLCHVLLRALWNWESFTTGPIIGFIFLFLVCRYCYSTLVDMAGVGVDQEGKLAYGGVDLGAGGLTEYYHDAIYLSVFVLVGTCFSDWFWLTFLLVPVFVVVKLWTSVIAPWIFAAPPPEETEEDRKRREKKERKAERQDKFRNSRR